MADTASLPGIAHSTNGELLNLYLSLPRESREKMFITTAHAAEITGVSMRTIQLWIECGAVRAIAVGRKYRIVLESLRDYLEGQNEKELRTSGNLRSRRSPR
jgi:excisionase family DNA binding protein